MRKSLPDLFLKPAAPHRLFAEVALALPSVEPLHYAIPEKWREHAAVGCRVRVNVRNRKLVGYIVSLSGTSKVESVKEIEGLIDTEPVLGEEMLRLTRWMSERYFCSWGQAIEAAMPAPFKKGKLRMKGRERKSVLIHEAKEQGPFILSPAQDKAYRQIREALDAGGPKTFLLHGITGSGKTEVYMHVIRDLLKKNKTAIVLVPEISLTPQAVSRFKSRFGDCLAVIHSRLSQGRRVEEWHRIRSGAAKVVVGARSAIFSPMQRLGLIVIDEEHDGSYKQDETPRYLTRKVAERRAELTGAVLVCGSATPSLEMYHEAVSDKIGFCRLPERIEQRPLPAVEIVDVKLRDPKAKERIFSSALEEAVKAALEKKEQVMLLLNRRGFSVYLHCSSCGYVMTCPNCRLSLAYHYDKGAVFCHLCRYRGKPERLCPGCQKNYLHYFGMGTQKIEMEAVRLFPGARIARMDADSTSRKESHAILLEAFRKKDIDILVGTQMIAKGHDFPNVSLIGVMSADTALHLPDFRAAERTFDLLTQVAGRAGRGNIPGRVVIQTMLPSHYAVKCAQNHDYELFYAKEIEFRKELHLPPAAEMVKIVLSGTPETHVARQLMELSKFLESRLNGDVFSILGPSPGLVSKQSGLFYWNLYVKGPSTERIAAELRPALAEFKKIKSSLTVDVDPQ